MREKILVAMSMIIAVIGLILMIAFLMFLNKETEASHASKRAQKLQKSANIMAKRIRYVNFQDIGRCYASFYEDADSPVLEPFAEVSCYELPPNLVITTTSTSPK